MGYNLETLQKFSKAKVIKNLTSTRQIKYSPDGKILCVSTPNFLNVYGSLQGNMQNTMPITMNVFDYSLNNNILYTNDDTIQHLSLFDSKIVGNFKHHSSKINQIISNPFDDKFISTCDCSTLIWDLRMANPTHKIDIRNSLGTFINNNVVLNVNAMLKFYDLRNLFGPLKTVEIKTHKNKNIFSTKKYFVLTDYFTHSVFNHAGELVFSARTESHSSAAISPDERYLLCTSSVYIFCYEIVSKKRVHTIKEMEFNMGAIDFNPVYCQFATSSSELKFWMPMQADK